MITLTPLRSPQAKIIAFAAGLAVSIALCCVSVASQKGKAFNEADRELNDAYNKVLSRIADPEDKRLYLEAQRAWLKFRDAEVAFDVHYFPGGAGATWKSIDMIQTRTEELKRLLTPAAREAHADPNRVK
jgi:uncharacterized protein YecT (DUF1311 family)